MAVNTVGGMGGSGGLSSLGFRNTKTSRETEDLAGLAAKEAPQPFRTAGSERDYRAWQATEEGFARLRVGLQSTAGKLEISSAPLPESAVGGKSALEKFQEYMDKSPAEKMRDAILAEMGLTEDDLNAMPPEKREAVEKEIAERFQQRMEMQAKEAEEERQGENPNIDIQA